MKRALPAAVCLVLGFGAGWLLRTAAPARGDPPPRTSPKAVRTAKIAPAASSDVEALRSENFRLRALNEALEIQAFGIPPDWPSDAPPDHHEAFEANLRAALVDCDVDVELVAVDCAEPPCTAVFRNAEHDFWNKLINTCPGWVDRYGSSAGTASGSVSCGDGRVEGVIRIYPGGWEPPEPEGAPERNGTLRMQARWDEMEAGWTCAPPDAP